jgi:2-oxoglutaroyl-CoA hydrolase
MADKATFDDKRLADLDGFTVVIDAVRQRADITLDRPPYNVVSMLARDQLRLVFEALDEDDRVRIIVVTGAGEHFSSGGNIKGFLEATPEHVSKLAWNIAAPARCSKRRFRTVARLRLPHRDRHDALRAA